MAELSCVVSGSFGNDFDMSGGRWSDSIMSLAAHLENNLGVRVLKPDPAKIVDKGAAFMILSTDEVGKSPATLELEYLEAIEAATIHLIYNSRGGRIGRSSAAEMAYARLVGTPTITTFAPQLPELDVPYPEIWFPGDAVTPEESAALLETRDPTLNGLNYHRLTHNDMQSIADRTLPLPPDDPHTQTLNGIWQGLLTDLAA